MHYGDEIFSLWLIEDPSYFTADELQLINFQKVHTEEKHRFENVFHLVIPLKVSWKVKANRFQLTKMLKSEM